MIEKINNQIKSAKNSGFDIQKISDGYHTFEELYEHRIMLFLALANQNKNKAWKYIKNADGQGWEGWFGLGIFPEDGNQITYHLPIKYWDDIDCKEYEINPFFDGHNSKDVLERLKKVF